MKTLILLAAFLALTSANFDLDVCPDAIWCSADEQRVFECVPNCGEVLGISIDGYYYIFPDNCAACGHVAIQKYIKIQYCSDSAAVYAAGSHPVCAVTDTGDLVDYSCVGEACSDSCVHKWFEGVCPKKKKGNLVDLSMQDFIAVAEEVFDEILDQNKNEVLEKGGDCDEFHILVEFVNALGFDTTGLTPVDLDFQPDTVNFAEAVDFLAQALRNYFETHKVVKL